MKKAVIKYILSGLVLLLIVIVTMGWINEILVSKTNNRYYMLEERLEQLGGSYEVQVYGSCHSYTSFDALLFEQNYGLTTYVLGNAGEIMPTTYLRMADRFETDLPKVAVVEIWGINPYETYDSSDTIFGYYMPVNVERLPLSIAKLEVIQDFPSLSLLLDNFAAAKYKDRILEEDISETDFNYAFIKLRSVASEYNFEEMLSRFANNGYKRLKVDSEGNTELADYSQLQAVVNEDEILSPECDIVKYIDKVVELCNQYDVPLIFYRAPYISTENEIKKVNWLTDYCSDKNVLFIDTEKEIEFDPVFDFDDYYHLNENGAQKVTEYLAPYILAAAQKQ